MLRSFFIPVLLIVTEAADGTWKEVSPLPFARSDSVSLKSGLFFMHNDFITCGVFILTLVHNSHLRLSVAASSLPAAVMDLRTALGATVPAPLLLLT